MIRTVHHRTVYQFSSSIVNSITFTIALHLNIWFLLRLPKVSPQPFVINF